jgi:hypothetical protein
MEAQGWTVKQLIETLKKFPPEAKVFYEMGPNGAGTIGKAQYVKARGDDDELGEYCWTDRFARWNEQTQFVVCRVTFPRPQLQKVSDLGVT